MGKGILIIGKTGTGKSRSIKTLNTESTFLIKCYNKPLPYGGSSNSYIYNKDKVSDGNMYVSVHTPTICSLLMKISDGMPHIKVIIVDDFQFTMSELYFTLTKSLKLNEIFEVYRTIGRNNKNFFQTIGELREDLNIYVLCHSFPDDEGFHKIKMVGKTTEKEYSPEATVTIILHSLIVEGEYKFLTRNDGKHLGKSPENLFVDYIDNDLGMVDKAIREYF